MADFSIDPETTLGPIHLIVSDLNTSLGFYRDILGMVVLEEGESRATLGSAGTPIVALSEVPGAPPRPPRSTGLYHFAILLPTRADLARVLRRLAQARYPLGGASDHLVSEALYLDDPEGNGIEIYIDRPRESWPRSADGVAMATNRLDLEDLMGEIDEDDAGWEAIPVGTRLGHVHLHVADIPRAEAFYHGVLGFDIMARYGPQASFLSAGGYHHHVGMNTWAGVGAPPPPEGSAGLEYVTIFLPNAESLDAEIRRARDAGVAVEERHGGFLLSDPSHNRLLMTTPTPHSG